ncbi:MAG: hypothetical protein OXI41_03180 [Chloroflexota bacterium]|nr:hypothetical protein [Chloroflexota bacterium]
MTARWQRLRPRDITLFVVVAVAVAVAVVIVGRELGIGQQTDATAVSTPAVASASHPEPEAEEASPLTLSLWGAEICETERGRGYAGSEFIYDDDGKAIGTRSTYRGWDGFAELPVRWEISGGTPPYALVIDNETRDGDGPYEGASGVAYASCAVTSAEVFYTEYDERRYRSDPRIDSGPKAIRATVTDSTGATAVASHDIYVILNVEGDVYLDSNGAPVSHRFGKGKTYRVKGFLLTFPADAESGDTYESHGESGFTILFSLEGYRGWIAIASDTGTEHSRVVELYSRPADAVQGSGSTDEDVKAALNSLLTDLMRSLGKPPSAGAQ